MGRPYALAPLPILLFILLFVVVTSDPTKSSTLETWQANQQAAAAASKLAHFAEAEQLLVANEKLAETLKRAEGKSQEAASLYEQAIAMWEKLLGPDSPDLAPDLNNLGAIYELGREKGKAEPLFLRAIALDEKVLGRGDPGIGERSEQPWSPVCPQQAIRGGAKSLSTGFGHSD